jgi:diguanylate cyclase (GGDEF)-like protein/PAS domain S-box-containing protein
MVTGFSYVFSAFSIPPFLTVLVTLVAALRLVSRSVSRTRLAMIGMAAFAIGWQGSFAMMYLAADPRTAEAWGRAGLGCVPFLAPAIYQFVVELLRIAERRKVATRVGWLVAAQFGILAVTTDYVVTGVRAFRWGFYPAQHLAASIPSLLFFAGYLGAAIWELTRAYPQARGIEQKRLGLLGVAIGIADLAAVDYLAVFGIAVYPFGWLALLGYMMIATWAIAHYGLQPITPALAANEIIGTIRDVLFVSDRDGRILFANSAACVTLGYSQQEFQGRRLEDFLVPVDQTDPLRSSTRDTEYVFRTKGGEQLELSVSRSPVFHHSETTGTVFVGRDLRDRKRYEVETRRAVSLLQSTLESTADGILAVGSDGEILSWNRRLVDMWRIPRRMMNSSSAIGLIEHMAAQLIDPADFLGSVPDPEAPDVEVTHLLEFHDGRRFEQYSASRSADMRVWSFRDVTARRRAEEALRNSEARYRLLFEQNAAGVCVTTMHGRIIDCNATFADLVGDSPDDLTRRSLRDVFARSEEWETIVQRLAVSPVIRGAETELRRSDGTRLWVLQNLAVLGRGETAVIHLTAVDIGDRKRAEAQIEFQAYHDTLTQLPNRRLLKDRLELSILAAKRARRNVAVLFIDLDGFKEVNDTLGHGVGDVVLCEVADRLRGAVRKTDTVARFGGDEFTVMLPDLIHPEDAAQVAQKILDELARPIPLAVPPIELTASIGIAVCPRDAEDLETLLRNADAAMYRVKEARRSALHLS